MFAPTTTDDDMRQNREALDAVYGGVENANKAYIALKGVVEYKTFGQPWGRDQEYLRGRTFNRNELLALLGVSAGVLGEISDVNRANLEGLIEILYRQEVQPLQDIVEESVNLWARAVGIQDWDSTFAGRRSATRELGHKNAETRIKSGQATPNEERVRQGKAPYPGGNRFYMPTAVQEVGRDKDDEVGEQEPETIKPPEPQPALPADQQGDQNQDASGQGQEVDAGDQPAQKVAVVAELRRWKRTALRMAKGEIRQREFQTNVVPLALRQGIGRNLGPMARLPDAVREYFDGLIVAQEKAEDVQSEVDALPAWAGDRLEERAAADVQLTRESRSQRLARLVEVE